MFLAGFIAIVAVVGPIVLGAIAFLRTTRYAEVIVSLEERVRTLETAIEDGVVVERRVEVTREVRPNIEADGQPALEAPQPPQPPPAPVAPHIPAPEAIILDVPSQEVEPDPAPEAARAARRPFFASFDWVYWLFGGAIACAIVIGVAIAANAGALGTAAQSLGGLVLAAGLIYGATTLPRLPTGAPDRRAQLLGAAGVFCGLATALAGHHIAAALNPTAGLAAWGATALAALALSILFGSPFAWGGLIAGLAGPLLFKTPIEHAFMASTYLVTLTAATLALGRLGGWRVLSWVTLAGALAWGGGLSALWGPAGAAQTAAYLIGLWVIAAVYAWDTKPPPLVSMTQGERWTEAAGVAHTLGAGGVALLLALLFVVGPAAPFVGVALVGAACIAICASVVRDSVTLFAVTATAAAVVGLATWPGLGPAELRIQFVGVGALALGLVSSLGGWAMMLRHANPTAGALVAALGPIGALAAAWFRLGDVVELPWAFGVAAAVLAAAQAFAFWRLRAAGGEPQRGLSPSSSFALGASLSAALAVGSALPGLWLAAGLAALTPIAAVADRRFNLAGARAAVGGVAGLVVLLLTLGLAPLNAPISTTPIANELVIVYVIAIVALYAAATILGRSRGETALPEGLRAGCIALVVAFAAYSVRHLVHAGDMRAAYASAVELGLQTSLAAAAAFALGFRYFGDSPKRQMPLWAETALFVLSCLLALGLIFAINPAWGMLARPAANGLELAYGAPAAVFAAYSWMTARAGRPEPAAASGWAAAALALVWLTLAVRAAADGPDLAGAPISLSAHWGLSLAWLAYAAVLGAISVAHPAPGFKQASAALFVAAVVKILVIDLSPLDPIMRAFASLLVGAFAVGAAMVYQRFVFGRAASFSRRRVDPNLMPPS